MEELYSKIGIWFNETFGENPDLASVMIKLSEEITEMEIAIDNYTENYTNRTELMQEFADVMMVMFRLMQKYGVTWSELVKAVKIKHVVNEHRAWEEKEDGSFKHVEA